MEYVAVPTGKIPALGLGTWLLEGDDCRRAVAFALDRGYRHIDTAQIYGNEAEIGDVLEASDVDRSEVFLTTKVWNDHRTAAQVEQSVTESLRKLRTDYVDLLLVHWPVGFERIAQTLQAMADLQSQGLARSIGVSNFTARQFTTAAEIAPVVCNQVEYHPFLDQRPLLETVRSAGGVLTAYSPLARGAVLHDDTLVSIGQAHGKTPAQVALRWLLDHNDVLVVPKATSPEHIAANLDVFDFTLADDERDRIDRLARGERHVDPPFAPDWED